MKEYENISEKLSAHKEQVKQGIEEHLSQFNETAKKQSSELRQMKMFQQALEPSIKEVQADVKTLKDTVIRIDSKVDTQVKEINDLDSRKLDRSELQESLYQIEDRLAALANNYSKNIDRMLTNENYVQKYLPITIQRQISEVLQIVLKRSQKRKLEQFNDIKMPILQKSLFEDDGIPNLQKWQQQFHECITQNQLTDLEDFIQKTMSNEKEIQRQKWKQQQQQQPIPSKETKSKEFKIGTSQSQNQRQRQLSGSKSKRVQSQKASDNDIDNFKEEEQEDKSESDKEPITNDMDSIDFEEQIRKELNEKMNQKINTFEIKLIDMVNNHINQQKQEINKQGDEFKKEVQLLNKYVEELHNNQINDNKRIKKEREEQVTVNQMLAMKYQTCYQIIEKQQQINKEHLDIQFQIDKFIQLVSSFKNSHLEFNSIQADSPLDNYKNLQIQHRHKVRDGSLSPFDYDNQLEQRDISQLDTKSPLSVVKCLLEQNTNEHSKIRFQQNSDQKHLNKTNEQFNKQQDIYRLIHLNISNALSNLKQFQNQETLVKPHSNTTNLKKPLTREPSPVNFKMDFSNNNEDKVNQSWVLTGKSPSVLSYSRKNNSKQEKQLSSKRGSLPLNTYSNKYQSKKTTPLESFAHDETIFQNSQGFKSIQNSELMSSQRFKDRFNQQCLPIIYVKQRNKFNQTIDKV